MVRVRVRVRVRDMDRPELDIVPHSTLFHTTHSYREVARGQSAPDTKQTPLMLFAGRVCSPGKGGQPEVERLPRRPASTDSSHMISLLLSRLGTRRRFR